MPVQSNELYVFDADNTLVPHTETLLLQPFYNSLYELVSAEKPMDIDMFIAASEQAYFEEGCCVRSWAKVLNKDHDWILMAYGHVAGPLYKAVSTSPLVKPNPLIKQRLRQLEKLGNKLVILTQGHHRYSRKLIEFVDLADIFPHEALHDIVKVKGSLKRTAEPYEFILDTHRGYDAYHMVEDTPANLVPAHKLGFRTWYLAGKAVPEDVAPHIHHTHATIENTLASMLHRALKLAA